MNAIVVMYDPFAMESRISIAKGGHQEQVSVASTVEELAGTTVGLAYEHGIEAIKIHAPLSAYYEMKRVIEANEMSLYSKNTLDIGVI